MGKLLFIISFLLYFATATPVIHFEDNPQFLTTAYSLGIAHPPGYPLMNMIGNLAGIFPIGAFAFRLNILAALFCAGAVYYFYRCALLICRRRGASFAASVLFALSGNMWGQATVFEVYPLHYLFIFSILFIALSGRLEDFRWLLFSSFLFGLGVSNHLSFSLLLVPYVLIWLEQRRKWQYTMSVFNWMVLLTAGLLSWGSQFYITARSFSGDDAALFSWGKVKTPWAFINYITGGIYADMPFNTEAIAERLSRFHDYALEPIFILPIALAVAGAMAMLKEKRLRTAAIASGILLLVLYSMVQTAAMEILLLPPWGFILLLCAYAISYAKLPGNIPSVASALAILLAIPLAWHQYGRYDFHNDYLAYDYMSDIQDTLPENGRLVLVPGLQSNFIAMYGIYGPAKFGRSDTRPTGVDFTNVLSPRQNTRHSYGIFNSPEQPAGDTDEVWNHIRSFKLYTAGEARAEAMNARGLYRNTFKLQTAARIALQRGYYLLEGGKIGDAQSFFKTAAELDLNVVVEDAAIWHSWKEYGRAISLLESAEDAADSPWISKILAAMVVEGKIRPSP